MFKSLFSKETFNILKNKKLLIAIVAVIFIPILYAGMFLWAFWDPYAFLDDIPIAVVNEDEGYTFEDEYLTIGDELVENLKKEADFDFHFVNKAEGYQGLQAQDYYILIQIPKDFSKNATTVMDHPEKLELIYVPNESFNFLAAQMGETAMLQIQQALQEQITETYAETIFGKIDDVAIQLVDASEATDELNDGAHELQDGSKEIKDNLNILSDKMEELSDGVDAAYKGSEDLAEGSAILSSGIDELYDNSEKLKDASEDLQAGADQLENGMKEVNDGVQQFQEIVKPISETDNNELYNHLSERFSSIVMKVKDPINDKVDEILRDKQSELTPTISDGLSEQLADQVSETTDAIVDKANNIILDAPGDISSHIANIISKKTSEKMNAIQDSIIKTLKDAGADEHIIAAVEAKLDELSAISHQIETTIQGSLETALNDVLQDVHLTGPDQEELKANIINVAGPEIESLVTSAFDEAIHQVDGAFEQFDEDKLAEITSGFENDIKRALKEPMEKLATGVNSINKLADGTNELRKGSQKLVEGQDEYVNNMYKFTDSFIRANEGASELTFGSTELLTGMFTLKDGSIQLNDGALKLADGSDELYDGMTSLVDGTEEFNEKMHEAADEANSVNATDETNKMIASPVEVDNEKINEVPNYGTGFAPYFLSLGLFVGALLLSIVYPLRETSSEPSNGTEWFLRKFLVLFSIGIFQALIAVGILLIGLGIEVQSVPRFILYAIITSLTFITLIQFFVTCFDDPGRFIAIIILILQLTTSAGTFPLELIPKVLQPLNAVLPMTYSVAGFKAVISSGDFGVMWQNAAILLGFTTIFIVLTWIYFLISYKQKHNENTLVTE